MAFAQNLARPWSGAGEAGARSRSWRERWFLPLIGLAFASGGLLMAGVDYFAGRLTALDNMLLLASSGPAATADAAFAARAMAALKGFEPPAGGAAGLAAEEGDREQDEAAPVLPNLPAEGLKLTAVRVVPGERGKMLCMFYTKQDAGDLASLRRKNAWPKRDAGPLFRHLSHAYDQLASEGSQLRPRGGNPRARASRLGGFCARRGRGF